MKIIMDLTAVSSEESRNRGIGRYSLALSQELLKITNKKTLLLFNSCYNDTQQELLEEYAKTLPKKNSIFYTPLSKKGKTFREQIPIREQNSQIIKEKIVEQKDVDIYHVFSPFEGLEGDAEVIKESAGLKNIKLVLTVYDLIPLIFKENYLTNPEVKEFYMQKLSLLYEADKLLAISESTREDIINLLGIPQERVINIGSAIDTEVFHKTQEKSSIDSPFILYTGGMDFRKNIKTSIEAFSNLSPKTIAKYDYVIVCKIREEELEDLQKFIKKCKLPKEKIHFTNYISDSELNLLYNRAELFIFPSLYEGFGLPLLEAMNCATLVAGSNNSSISEIICKEEALFDATDAKDIAATIEKLLHKTPKEREELVEYFYNRAKEFSWEASAQKTYQAYKELATIKQEPIEKLKLALFTPLPNIRSGIADYTAELLPFLAKYAEIDIFIDDTYEVEDDYIKANFNIYSYKKFEGMKQRYDTLLYQFGNSEFHEYMYDIALKNAGIIVLHDFFLSGLVDYMAHKHNKLDFFIETLNYSHPNIPQKYFHDGTNYKLDIVRTINTLPMNKQIVESAKAIIVHSDYAKSLFSHYYKNSTFNIHKIPQLIKTPSQKSIDTKEEHKKLLGFDTDTIIISAFGHITDTKQYDFILDAFHTANICNNTKIKLLFVGDFLSQSYREKITARIQEYNFTEQLLITGYTDDARYRSYLLATDICLNLRINSRGETSRALLMNMAYAKPTIVNDYATFSELPDIATAKVKLNSQEDFLLKLHQLIEDKEYRATMAKEAYNYISSQHRIDKISREYYKICSIIN